MAGQELVWVDLDAADLLLKQAENQGSTSLLALPWLEEALRYLERGAFLEGETGRWRYGFQQPSERLLKRCRLWLAENYETRENYWQAGEQYRRLLQTLPPDEKVLQRGLTMFQRQGETADALKWYQEVKTNVEAQGFTLSPEPAQVVASLNSSHLLSLKTAIADIIEERHILEKQDDMDTLRRVVTQSLFGITAAATVVAPYDFDLLERFSRVIAKPCHLDKTVLTELENRTSSYWQYRLRATFPSPVLLEQARGHFSLLVHLLQGPLSLSERGRLCALGSETAQVIGMLLFDLRAYAQARKYFHVAIQAAQEGEHTQ